MRYHVVNEGEWVQPRRKNYFMKCCHCGLVHSLDFRLIKRKNGAATIQFRARIVDRHK